MIKFIKKQPPGRLIAFGFLSVILLGSALLMLPCSVREGVELRYIDALYTSTSAVCVTGLLAVDTGTVFSPIGQFFIALLIQIGGLGVTSVGAGVILAMGGKFNLKSRTLLREALNMDSAKGIITLVKSVLCTTLVFEFLGAALSFTVFVKDYPPLKALGYSLFHSIASFNNAGFDNLGLSGDVYNNINLIPYQDNVMLNLVTCGLIFFGGIGFLVIREVISKRFKWKKLSMHSRVVISFSVVLIVVGTVLIKLTQNDISWLGALFHSVSARTAGFSTYSLGTFSNAALLVIAVLMFVGASPGSTGGGVKTSTLFVLMQGIKSAATNKSEKAFHFAVPKESFKKASVIVLLGATIIVIGTVLMAVMEPHLDLMDILFEMVSAFGTVGLSTGITSTLGVDSKMLSILIMYIGRLGPLTIASLWYFDKGERVNYPEGNISIG